MFEHEDKVAFLAIPDDAIAALYVSSNAAPVILQGRAPVLASAVIAGYRQDGALYGVVIALHLQELEQNIVFTHDDDGLDPAGARVAAQEAIALLESMGFRIKEAAWSALDAAARPQQLATLKVFTSPPSLAAPARLIDAAPSMSGVQRGLGAVAPGVTGPVAIGQRTVLLLEDDPDLRAVLNAALESLGLQVLQATRCSEADEHLRRQPIHVMIVDGALPDGSGAAFIERVRATNRSVPIIFMSAHATFFRDLHMHRRLTRDLKVSSTFRKPVHPVTIAERVLDVLHGDG